MSQNIEFMLNPRSFLTKHLILIPQRFENGLMYVDLEKNTEGSSLLIKNNSFFTIGSLYAQCLMPRPNQDNPVVLNNEADYFFTPNLSGCQILIYKEANGDICIEHNNHIDHPEYYIFHYLGVALYNPSVYCIHATNHSRWDYGEGYEIETTDCCVVGVRWGSVWTFYYKNNNTVREHTIQI